jgi:hypothetical protein
MGHRAGGLVGRTDGESEMNKKIDKCRKLKIGERLQLVVDDLKSQELTLELEIKKLTKAGCVNGTLYLQEKRPGYSV